MAAAERLTDLLEDVLESLDGGPAQSQYVNGVWSGPGAAAGACWRCTLGASVAAAELATETGSDDYYSKATESIDLALRYQQSSGAFVPPPASTPSSAPDVETAFTAVQLAGAYHALADRLDAGRRATWGNALARAADFLVQNNNLGWYTNGNIVLSNTVVMAGAWKATGDDRFRVHFETALQFALSPPDGRWDGYGIVYTRQPTASDGRDGAAYLTEQGAGAPGYDPDYTQLQADLATRLYQITGDGRALRLMNLLLNQLLQDTNTDTWVLDISNGSRHPAPNQWRWLTTPALAVLSWEGGRTDLAPLVDSQLEVMSDAFTRWGEYSKPGLWFEVGSRVSLTLAMTS